MSIGNQIKCSSVSADADGYLNLELKVAGTTHGKHTYFEVPRRKVRGSVFHNVEIDLSPMDYGIGQIGSETYEGYPQSEVIVK